MKILFLYQFFIFKIIISNPILNYIKNEEKNSTLKDIFLLFIQNEKKNISKIINNIKSKECRNFLNTKYSLNDNITSSEAYLNYLKLVLDSSKNINDISTFRDCMQKRYGIELAKNETNNYSYVLVFIDERNRRDSTFNDTTYLFALCLAYKSNTCPDEDYRNLFINFYQKYVSKKDFTDEELKVFSFEDTSNEYTYKFISFEQIPLYIIILIFFLTLFKNLIIRLLNLKKNDIQPRETIKSKNTNFANQSQKINYQKIFESAFSFSKNIDILFDKENEEDIYNDTGINYIKGIKGLSMIFYLFGTLFFNLYNSPISQKNRRTFYESLGYFLNCIFFVGLKYSPRILLSCSGFSLFYKFIHYLDEKTEEKREERINKEKNHSFIHYTNICMLFSFILHQIYKYILFLLVVFFMLYSIFLLNLVFIDINPMWVYFDHSLLKKISFTQIISLFFGFQTYFLEKEIQEHILNYFWLVYNEIFYFLLTTFILYFIYKCNFQFFNRIIIIFFILIEIVKFVLTYFVYDLYSAFIFTYYNYGKFAVTSLINYPYFLIGIYFSMFNFTMQKRLNYGDCERQEKNYLKPILKAFKKLGKCEKNNIYKWGILFILLFIIFCISSFIMLNIIDIYFTTEKLSIYFRNYVIRFILMYDSEFVVILFHLFLFFFNISEENIIKYFFSHSNWNLLDRIYFSYILLINPIILYILYTGETKIHFTFSNCFLYSLISLFFLFISSTLFYLIFELPFKRIIKYIFKIKKNKKKEQIFGNIEDKFNLINNTNSSNIFDISNDEDYENEEEQTLTNKINKL